MLVMPTCQPCRMLYPRSGSVTRPPPLPHQSVRRRKLSFRFSFWTREFLGGIHLVQLENIEWFMRETINPRANRQKEMAKSGIIRIIRDGEREDLESPGFGPHTLARANARENDVGRARFASLCTRPTSHRGRNTGRHASASTATGVA